ncbi:superoxide dismutase [Roseovarius atlanticus]|uniref:Superoxide dismutase n=1 Tax=Roseovarius atlanticus TaxID=1641875 RepID=A0A0T5NUE4_9RHOB|nr:superoxide dismutase family protein [Roseovarius atlanticus]KRS12255.1 superoxide dismutase [Roseovarius atlanticus]
MRFHPLAHTAFFAAATALATAPALADADQDKGFAAQVEGSEDAITGTVRITPTASGVMRVSVDLEGVPAGPHGIHIHETGDCSASDFKSAGGHVAGDAKHGVSVEGGPHPGDLPNAEVGSDEKLVVTHFNERLTADHLTDDDGAAFIVHSGADDYESQPAGDAGARIACGVFEPAS